MTAPRAHGTVTAALAMYLAWTGATWFFDGRIETLLRPEAAGDRIVYALGVNLLLGIVGTLWLLRRFVRRDGMEVAMRSGFGPPVRTLLAAVAGLALGIASYFGQGAPSTDPAVVTNAFAQVFVVSAAEVLVCWALVGATVEAALRGKLARLATPAAAVIAAVLFGLYHFAHSAPFDTWPMVALLTVVGLVTGAFFFVSRDVLGTAIFHNFLGTFGVTQALAAAGNIGALEALQPALLGTAAVTAVVLLAGYRWVRRRR
jgi:hypothetical protein